MNNLQIFDNPNFGSVRWLLIEGEPWAVGKDIATVLGYANPRDALLKHVDAEDKGVSQIATPSGEQKMTIINESGLYSLILSSKLPTAKAFKHWVTSEVLPALRKQGSYTKPGANEKRLPHTNPIKFSERLEAANIIATCPENRLSYVLSILQLDRTNVNDAPAPRNESWTADVVGQMHRYNVSGSELARACGYSAAYLSTVLNGHKRFSSVESAERTKDIILNALRSVVELRN